MAIGGFYILGTLALLTPGRISVVTGLAQAGDAMAVRFGAWAGGSARQV